MRKKTGRLGCESQAAEDIRGGNRQDVACILTDPHDTDRFGEPSSYGMTYPELAAYIRQLRREGWQSWEIRVRFFGEAS